MGRGGNWRNCSFGNSQARKMRSLSGGLDLWVGEGFEGKVVGCIGGWIGL
jgi:hypothetical protein